MVKKSRYSSTVPGGSILPAHRSISRAGTEGESPVKKTAEPAANGVPGAAPTAVLPTARSKNWTRYSSQLPESWVASEVRAKEKTVDLMAIDKARSGLQQPGHSQFLQREARHLRSVSTKLDSPAPQEMEPPPAPVGYFPPILQKKAVSQIGGKQNKSLDESPRSSLAPVSSSTYSPHHGCDLPAMRPSVSPSYSVT